MSVIGMFRQFDKPGQWTPQTLGCKIAGSRAARAFPGKAEILFNWIGG